MSLRSRHTTPFEQRISAVGLTFGPEVSMVEVEGTLELARLAAQAIHGEERVELDAAACLDHEYRRVRIDTASSVGRTLALVFLGYARREFGRENVAVERVSPAQPPIRDGGEA